MPYKMSSRLNAASLAGSSPSSNSFSANISSLASIDDAPSINSSAPFDILSTNKDSTPIDKLPEELLSRAFELLSSQNPLIDIGNSRLVSRRFRNSSSPYLLTTVVIAERKEMLEKLREVIEQPYFSLHVTHLVWDASYFREDMTVDFGLFMEEQSNAMGCWNRPSLGDSDDFISKFSNYQPHKGDIGSKQDSIRPLPGDEPYDMTGLEGVVSEYDAVEFWQTSEGYAQYSRCYMDQHLMRREMLAWRYLHLAFRQFPKLRHLSYTDYRALSRHNEAC